MTSLPPELQYGHVVGRVILAVADTGDADTYPDAVPAQGTVTFTPKNPEIRVGEPDPVVVLKQKIVCTIDSAGYLTDPDGKRGVWLVTGVYTVSYSFNAASLPAHDIVVGAEHTLAAPLDLTLALPPGGPVLQPSQYAELTARIDSLVFEAAGVSSVNGATGAVVLDADDVGALPSSYTPPAQSWEQITSKPTTFTPTAHTHAYADITDPPTIPGPQTLSLTGSDLTLSDGGGTVTLPSGGGGGGSAYPQVAPESPRIFFPPLTNTGTAGLGQNVYLVPIEVPYGSITEIGIEVTTAAASSVLRLGLYTPWGNGTWPKNRLVDAGTVDVSTTGWKNIVLSTPIAWPGGLLYAAAYRPSTSTNPQVRTATGGSQRMPAFWGSFSNGPGFANINSTGFYMTGDHDTGLPATFNAATQNFAAILMGVRVA